MIAKSNAGIYDACVHRAYVDEHQTYIPEEDRQQYVGAHLKRLETLEKNDVVKALDGGLYQVPDDVIIKGEEVTKKISAREKKRFYPHLNVLSTEPLEHLIHAEKKTWLDRELYKQSKKVSTIPYDAGVEQALAERRDWLVKNDLAFIQSNGEFALRGQVMLQLDQMEVYAAGRTLAGKFGLEFSDKRVKAGQLVQYGGYVTLETGIWAVVSSGKDLQLTHVEEEPRLARGDMAVLKDTEGKMDLQKAEPSKVKSRGRDKDQETEL